MPNKDQLKDEARASIDRKDALRKAYGQATNTLRDNHRDEFNKLYAANAADLGVEWSPRLNDEQKAEQTFDQLLAEFPHLRERLTEEGAAE